MRVVVEKGAGAGTTFRLLDGVNTLGRDVANRIRLLDPRVSRNHCKIRKVGQSLFVIDLGTRNGTSVNGDFVTEAALQIGDQIKVGNTCLRIVDEEYEPEQTIKHPGPLSFFRQISMTVFSRRRGRKTDASGEDFAWFSRRSGSSVWRPHVDTDPPEGRQKTEASFPDAD